MAVTPDPPKPSRIKFVARLSFAGQNGNVETVVYTNFSCMPLPPSRLTRISGLGKVMTEPQRVSDHKIRHLPSTLPCARLEIVRGQLGIVQLPLRRLCPLW